MRPLPIEYIKIHQSPSIQRGSSRNLPKKPFLLTAKATIYAFVRCLVLIPSFKGVFVGILLELSLCYKVRQYQKQSIRSRAIKERLLLTRGGMGHWGGRLPFGPLLQKKERSPKIEGRRCVGGVLTSGAVVRGLHCRPVCFGVLFWEESEVDRGRPYKLWKYVQFLPQYQSHQMSALKQIKQKLADIEESSTELDLSKIKIGKFDEESKKTLEKYKKIQILILADCGLESLENLPNWKLTAIEISNNKLGDSCLSRLSTITTLTQIICVANHVESLDALKQLSSLKKLQEVDFSENPVAEKSNYRSTLFDTIKSLEVVDQKDVNGHEVEEEEEYDDEDEYGEDDEEFEGDEEDDDYEEEEESSEKPKKKRK